MQGGFDVYTLLFLALSVFVFMRLRSVLGQHNEDEEPRSRRPNPYRLPEPANYKVIPFPDAAGEGEKTHPWQGYAEEGSAMALAFDAMKKMDPFFSPQQFLEGARIGYEMIINAYANADRKTLRSMLSKEAYEGFISAILEREEQKLIADMRLVGIEKAQITEAELKGKTAHLTVMFTTKLITCVRNAAGQVVEGSDTDVTDSADVWTFARDLTSKDPNWQLVATHDPIG